jgi:hypothetical protein
MLHDDAHELPRKPIGLIEARQRIAERAFDLAALERDLDLVAGLVAGDDLELVAEHLLHHDRHVDAVAADAGAATTSCFVFASASDCTGAVCQHNRRTCRG